MAETELFVAGRVGEKALLRFLSDRPNIKTVYRCLDSDQAGDDACSRLVKLTPEGLNVHRFVPLFKDWNEVLQRKGEIADGKYLRESGYGLKEPPQEENVEIICMSEVDTQTVEWLWEPYMKVTIVQGNPGEGKPVAFCLDPETGFSWVGEYDITADELLSGAGGNTAAEAGISERMVQNAKSSMGGILDARRVGGQWYNFLKKKQPPETAS